MPDLSNGSRSRLPEWRLAPEINLNREERQWGGKKRPSLIHRWATCHLLQLLHTHGVNWYLTSSTFLPRYWLLLQKMKWKFILLHERSRKPTHHHVWGVYPTTGGATTHQWFGKAVLLSNITEVSGAAGLKPDVFPELSVVLGSTDMKHFYTAVHRRKMEVWRGKCYHVLSLI